VSNKSAAEIYAKNWTKIAKLVTNMSKGVREYVNNAEHEDIPDYDTLIMSMYILTMMCGSQWKYSAPRMEELLEISKNVYKLARNNSDTPAKADLQGYALPTKKTTVKN